MNLGSIVYVPPKGRLNSDAFMANISAYSSKYPIYFYSDEKGRGIENLIANPEQCKTRNRFTVNNCIFLFGLKIAMDAGLDYFQYLESDCRCKGDEWDRVSWEDFKRNPNAIVYGTPVVHNATAGGPKTLKRLIDFAHEYQETTGWPMAVHGGCPGLPQDLMAYPNGAVAWYETSMMAEIFSGFERDVGGYAMRMGVWDCEIGRGLYRKFGIGLFDKFSYATKTFSGYGETIMSEPERKALLISGKVSIMHQWKGAETFV